MKKIAAKLNKILKDPKFYTIARRTYFAFIFLVVFFSVYHVGYAKRIIPGVKIGGVFVGGMSYEEAQEALSAYLEDLETILVLTHEGLQHEISGDDAGLKYDVDGSVSRAFELGRTGNAFLDTKDKIASLVKTLRIKAYYDWNDEVLNNEFSQIRGEINQIAIDPAFSIAEDGMLIISPPSVGKKVSNQGIYDLVISSFDYLDFGTKEIPVKHFEPDLEVSDLRKVEDAVGKIIEQPIKITHGKKTWEASASQLLDFLSVVPRTFGNVDLVLNRTNFDSYVEVLAQEINSLPRGKVKREVDGVVVDFELIKTGEELDVRKFTEDFEEVLLGDNAEVVVVTHQVNNLGDPAKYGIFTLLGEGQSRYTGSAAPRAYNLTLAADRTGGVLVPPDGIYSFNNSVGEVSEKTGYDTAYIISNGRTVLGEGGGVCQTSTTLFRAVLNSGLPIITRHPHAYRVYYYELDQPVGFDASIYQPSLDFQFKNDTPNYVLVQSGWDSITQTLYFRIYGTPDGRTVEVTEPVVSNFIEPPKPLYQDDPELPKGTVKQIDFEAWGATSKFSRTVSKNGEILYQDNFSSTYQPWRAVYLVGTN